MLQLSSFVMYKYLKPLISFLTSIYRGFSLIKRNTQKYYSIQEGERTIYNIGVVNVTLIVILGA